MNETQQQENSGHSQSENHDADHHGKKTTIVVNGREKTVEGKEISYEQVVPLGLDPVPSGPNVVITVTYSDARGPQHTGMLTPGHSVEIKNGTRFNVKATDKS
jgi:hypothetical protein